MWPIMYHAHPCVGQGVMNYTRTLQDASTISDIIPFPIPQRSLNAPMYGYNSLHPCPTTNVASTLRCTGIIHYTLAPSTTNFHQRD